MVHGQWLSAFSAEVRNTSALEWIAICAAVAEVLLAKANKVLLYPAGILSTAIFMYIFLQPQTKLYADAILNIYYLVMSIYGWVLWAKRKNGATLPITINTPKDWLTTAAIAAGGWLALYLLLTRLFPIMLPSYTPSPLAIWDALLSSTAWAGMWLLAKRKLENWLLLNLSNLVAIPVYFSKHMPFTACLTIFLFIVAIFGFLQWRKQYLLLSAS